MRILLLGGSGLLGRPAREAFLAAGHDVTVVTRGVRSIVPATRLRVLVADRTDVRALHDSLHNEHFDLTVDFLSYDATDLDRVFSVPAFSPGRFVMISTGQVYLVSRDAKPPFHEIDAEVPPMDEPPAGSRAWHNWIYGTGKRRAEARLTREHETSGLPTLALRIPAVQGEDDGHTSARLWGWLERFRDGGPVLLPENGIQPVRFVYAGDVAIALQRLAEGTSWPEARALNLAQPEEETLRTFVTRVAELAGATPQFVPVSAQAIADAGLDETCAPYWGRWYSRPDPTLALRTLGFRTRSPAEYLPAVVRAHLADPPRNSHDGYLHRAEELKLARAWLTE